jgi:3-oxoacyl-(acyl-carrier-protein) synthase
MLAGAVEGSSHYCWAGFDAMRVLARGYNDEPESASRPMSASACGFVPSAGAGILMLESLESALARGAKIYAEILGAHINCGGQRGGGSISAPNPIGVQKCIREAVMHAGVSPKDIDLISGHLTATKVDPLEIDSWHKALELPPYKFPFINSTKSLIGHALGACGSIECIASILQLKNGFVHASINCEDIHPDLMPYEGCIPRDTQDFDGNIVAKASFGFGDVNSCVIFKRGAGDE